MTRLRCGESLNDHVITQSLLSSLVKDFFENRQTFRKVMDNLLLLLHMPLVPARIPESHWLEYQHTLIVVLLNILRSVNVHRRGFDPVEDLIRHLQLRHLVDKRGVSHSVKRLRKVKCEWVCRQHS